MTKKQRKKLARRTLHHRAKDRERLFKEVSSAYKSLLDDVVKAEKLPILNWGKFQTKLTNALFKNVKNNVKGRTAYLTNLWGVKDNTDIPIVQSRIITRYKGTIGEKVTGIFERDRKRLERIIKQGKEEGRTTSEIAKEIKETVGNMSYSRAKTIANTEVNSAYSEIDRNLAVVCKMQKKTWIHGGVAEVDREEHLALDGTTIDLNEQFTVNGHKCDCPHDSSLPVEEVINCSCMCIYE